MYSLRTFQLLSHRMRSGTKNLAPCHSKAQLSPKGSRSLLAVAAERPKTHQDVKSPSSLTPCRQLTNDLSLVVSINVHVECLVRHCCIGGSALIDDGVRVNRDNPTESASFAGFRFLKGPQIHPCRDVNGFSMRTSSLCPSSSSVERHSSSRLLPLYA